MFCLKKKTLFLQHNLINKKDIIKKKERNFIGNLTVLFEISFIVI